MVGGRAVVNEGEIQISKKINKSDAKMNVTRHRSLHSVMSFYTILDKILRREIGRKIDQLITADIRNTLTHLCRSKA